MKKSPIVLILICITLLIFVYSIEIRSPWFGILGGAEWDTGRHQGVTAHTLVYTTNWLRQGIWNLKFTLSEEPVSPLWHVVYLSYTPVSTLPIYFLSLITNMEPTPALVMGYNLFNHFFIALLAGLIVFYFLQRLGFQPYFAGILSLLPLSLILLLPSPLYWLQNVYHYDESVILPFILYVFLELLRDGARLKKKKVISRIQIAVMLFGTGADWLFVFVALVVFGKRMLFKTRKNLRMLFMEGIRFFSPVALVISLHLLHIAYWKNVTEFVINKFLVRSGVKTTYDDNFYERFWLGFIGEGLGKPAVFLLWGSLVLLIVGLFIVNQTKKMSDHIQTCSVSEISLVQRTKEVTALMGMLLIPCFLQVYVFKNHSWVHDFSALKFVVPFSIISFTLLPILLNDIIRIGWERFRQGYFLFSSPFNARVTKIWLALWTIGGVFYLLVVHPQYEHMFPDPRYDFKVIGEFINQHTGRDDLVFSPHHRIRYYPSQQVAFSQKVVYRAGVEEMYEKVKNIKEHFVVNLFFLKERDALIEDIRRLKNNYIEADAVHQRFYQIEIQTSKGKIKTNLFVHDAEELKQMDDFTIFKENAFLTKNEGEMKLYKLQKEDFFKAYQQWKENAVDWNSRG